jgi:hypothetical protein
MEGKEEMTGVLAMHFNGKAIMSISITLFQLPLA